MPVALIKVSTRGSMLPGGGAGVSPVRGGILWQGELRLGRRCAPGLHPGEAALLKLGDDLVGDVVVEIGPVVARTGTRGRSGHRGSPRRAGERSSLTSSARRDNRRAPLPLSTAAGRWEAAHRARCDRGPPRCSMKWLAVSRDVVVPAPRDRSLMVGGRVKGAGTNKTISLWSPSAWQTVLTDVITKIVVVRGNDRDPNGPRPARAGLGRAAIWPRDRA